MKIRPVGAELFHADGQTVRHGDVIVTFRKFANARTPRFCHAVYYVFPTLLGKKIDYFATQH